MQVGIAIGTKQILAVRALKTKWLRLGSIRIFATAATYDATVLLFASGAVCNRSCLVDANNLETAKATSVTFLGRSKERGIDLYLSSRPAVSAAANFIG